ncbi:MAG TPA: hypothetical protein VL359_11700, partial [bacterium]|nr:hypothetical protein [bacterium]
MPRMRNLLRNDRVQAHRDTLERLIGGDFAELTPEQRQERVEDIIRVSASAAVATAALPIPFLDLPVLVAMVGAIGRVHGLEVADRQMYVQVLGTLGGGIFLRQVLRLVPFGEVVYASQIYGATWALGRVAHLYSSSDQTPSSDALQRIFEETLTSTTREHQFGKPAGNAEQRLNELKSLRERNLISEQEYEDKR